MTGRGKRRTVAPRKRGGPPVEQRSAIELEPGDVIYWDGERVVVTAPAEVPPGEEDSSRARRLVVAGFTAGGNVGANHHGIFISSERRFIIADRIDFP